MIRNVDCAILKTVRRVKKRLETGENTFKIACSHAIIVQYIILTTFVFSILMRSKFSPPCLLTICFHLTDIIFYRLHSLTSRQELNLSDSRLTDLCRRSIRHSMSLLVRFCYFHGLFSFINTYSTKLVSM